MENKPCFISFLNKNTKLIKLVFVFSLVNIKKSLQIKKNNKNSYEKFRSNYNNTLLRKYFISESIENQHFLNTESLFPYYVQLLNYRIVTEKIITFDILDAVFIRLKIYTKNYKKGKKQMT